MTDDYCITTHSAGETSSLGERIGVLLHTGICIALQGQLGAGKTQLVKGIARGCGVPDDVMVNSPTFVIINEYPGRLCVHHIDAYRLAGGDELVALGFEEMVQSGAVVVVEWASRVDSIIPEDHLSVGMEHAGDTVRRICCRATGKWSGQVVSALRASP